MARILVLFAHPLFEKSRVQSRLATVAKKVKGLTFHDLYETYPDFDIDIDNEKELLLSHDIVILQHPFYWYSAPPILKQWMDLVLAYGWAYGKGGVALTGKYVLQVVSAGGKKESYSTEGRHKNTVRQFLSPFEQSFLLCHMNYLPPFVIHGTHRLGIPEIEQFASRYSTLLTNLQTEHWLPSQLTGEEYPSAMANGFPTNTEYHGY